MLTSHRSNEKIKTQWLVLGLGIVLMLLKFGAFLLTHSNAILSDALESIVNILAGSFGLFSLYLSAKPRDIDHPYGHGKIEFISATAEGIMIGLAGIGILYKSIYNIIHPAELEQLGLGLILVLVSGILNFAMGKYAISVGKKGTSLALVASGAHLISDAYSTAGIVVGLMIVLLTDILWLDNVIAILMGIFIMVSGYRILKKSVAGIMDEADFKLNEKVIQHIQKNRQPDWIDVHNFRVIKYGEVIHIDCHMTMPWYYDIRQSHYCMLQLEACINDALSNPVETFIHIDPCEPISCEVCSVQNCPHRQKPQQKTIAWTLVNVVKNRKHSLEYDQSYHK
jgi:cation diffusion facilitator family transporter